jgi:hypothetical protein
MPSPFQSDFQFEPIAESGWDEFFRYINDHRRDNGMPEPLIHPDLEEESARPYKK